MLIILIQLPEMHGEGRVNRELEAYIFLKCRPQDTFKDSLRKIKDTLKAFNNLVNKQKCIRSNVF